MSRRREGDPLEVDRVASEHDRSLGRRPRVLVADDDPGIRLVCVMSLGADGYDVIEAEDGQEALEIAFTGAADIVMLELSMPVLDGFGVATALRADERTQNLPFVFLTSELDPQFVKRGRELGASGYFTKPFEPRAIAALLRRIIAAQSTWNDEAAAGGHAF